MFRGAVEGMGFGVAGYIAGTIAYTVFRVSIEETVQSILRSKCNSKWDGMACKLKDNLSAEQRLLRVWWWAFDPIELLLSGAIGGFLGATSSFLAGLPMFDDLLTRLRLGTGMTLQELSTIQVSLSNMLFGAGIAGSIGQNALWSLATKEQLSFIPVVVTAFVGGLTNAMSLEELIGVSTGYSAIFWNTASYAISTAFTRYGSSYYDLLPPL